MPAPGTMRDDRSMTVASTWRLAPGAIVTVAGFQNIEPRPPEPDAAPALDWPVAEAAKELRPKAPAEAGPA